MTTLNIKGTEYKVRFGYNCFCDTDLLDRVQDIGKILNDNGAEDDSDVAGLNKIKDLFSVVRELIFVGFQKYNPVEDIKEIGDLLDDYLDEATEEDKRGLIQLFTLMSEELVSEGFLKDLFAQNEQVKKPKDHLKKVK